MIEVNTKFKRNDFTLDVSVKTLHRVTALFGPSGAGKTTLLSLIAGINKPDSGYITIDRDCVYDSSKNINKPMHHRRVGMVFQDARLFPHMSVEKNLNYAIKFNKTQNQLISKPDLVKLLEIETLLNRHPHQLSGGEKQRVALGRTLLSSPRVLLLDEPLASLDEKLKLQIIPYLKLITSSINIPILYVSHNKTEIRQLTDHILYMQKGAITPTNVIV